MAYPYGEQLAPQTSRSYTVLRVLVNAPWYVPNWLLHRDLNIPSVRDVITRLSARYCGRL
jgi:hypothetical protein